MFTRQARVVTACGSNVRIPLVVSREGVWQVDSDHKRWADREGRLMPSVGLDNGVPTAARVYDVMLGGKDNYTVDQEV